MSDQTQTIDESTLDPAVVQYFTNKFAPVVSKRDELLAEASSLKALKKELDGLGGLDTVKSLKQKADEAAAAAEQARLEKLSKEGDRAELEKHYKAQLAERDGKLQAFQNKLLSKEVDAAITAAIGDEGYPKLLLPHLRDRVQASFNADGEVVLAVKGAAGQELTMAELIAEFKASPDYAAGFKAHAASGGGTKRTTGSAQGNNPFVKGSENLTKQSELIKNSPAVAKQLAKAAGWSDAETNW